MAGGEDPITCNGSICTSKNDRARSRVAFCTARRSLRGSAFKFSNWLRCSESALRAALTLVGLIKLLSVEGRLLQRTDEAATGAPLGRLSSGTGNHATKSVLTQTMCLGPTRLVGLLIVRSRYRQVPNLYSDRV